MRGDRRLVGLATVHVLLGLLAAALAPVRIQTPFGLPILPIVPLFAFVFAQVSLLGLWAVFAPAVPARRALGLVIGTAGLEVAFDRAFWPEFLLMPSAAMALTLAALLVVRALGVRLARRADGAISPRPEAGRLRITIRGLMLVTVAVAFLSAVARAIRQSPAALEVVVMIFWAVCFVTVGLLALRALTRPEGPLWRGLTALVVSLVLGVFFGYAVAEDDRDAWIYILTIMLLDPAILLGSLLVVRACGFVLARPTAESFEGPAAAPESTGAALGPGR